jgi:hypothetical protein
MAPAEEQTMTDAIDTIAALVRAEAERLARACGYDSSLEGWCGIVSGALAVVLGNAGIHAEMAGGWAVIGDYEEGHYWVLVAPAFAVPAEQWADYATLIDLTATQYATLDVPRVVRLEGGDERRRMYDLRGLGAEACLRRMSDGDLALLERLVERCRATARMRGAA